MLRSADVFFQEHKAGIVWQDTEGYHFQYDATYLQIPNAQAISYTLPLDPDPISNSVLHPFFDGLIPEGWLLDIAVQSWKANPNDRMGLLLVACNDCIGAVSIQATTVEGTPYE